MLVNTGVFLGVYKLMHETVEENKWQSCRITQVKSPSLSFTKPILSFNISTFGISPQSLVRSVNITSSNNVILEHGMRTFLTVVSTIYL